MDASDQGILLAVLGGTVVLGLALVWLALYVAVHAIGFALDLFEWATDQGFIGVALYIIVWVIALPLMLIVCVIGGLMKLREEKQLKRGAATRKPRSGAR